MMDGSTPFLAVELGGIRLESSGIELAMHHSGRFDFPGDFPSDGLQRAMIDLQLIGEKLRENGEDVRRLLQAVVSGDNVEVRRLQAELGLRESDFQERGGGIFWAVVIVGVLCCAGSAY